MASLSLTWLFLMCFALTTQTWVHQSLRTSFGPDTDKYAVGILPNVNYKLPPSWAGQIAIPGTTDNELFFWLFKAESRAQSDNLIIWLNGGPGCSSLQGLTSENGPLAFYANATKPAVNPYSWTKLANVLYVDQPVGAGYSTGSNQATNNAQVTQQFYAWLKGFYDIFPNLKEKNTYLMGESYAGVYIPYLTQTILQNKETLDINLKSITIGDGTIGNYATMSDVVVSTWMHRHNNLLGIPQDVLSVFAEADCRCGFTKVLSQFQYPPHGKIAIPGNPEGLNFHSMKRQNSDSCFNQPTTAAQVNESIYAPCNFGCATFTTAANYLATKNPCFNIYNINYTCRTIPNEVNVAKYLNLPEVRAAIHAPNKTLSACNSTILEALSFENVVPPAYSILPNIIEQHIPIHLYSGDYDFIVNNVGTEVVIQNMTW
ncbi:hypothetical protein MMC24_004769 [Lignoscripta atroalba]|nr:hypothetical protein [Lignoscripta atroalba]